MLAHRYQLALFTSEGALAFSVRVRGWVFVVLPLVLCVLAGVDWLLYDHYRQEQRAALDGEGLKRDLGMVNERLLLEGSELRRVEDSLARIEDFNAKLRIMLSMDEDADRTAALRPRQASSPGLHRLPALYGREFARAMHVGSAALSEAMAREEASQQSIARAVAEQLESLATIPVIMPTRGRFSSAFGWRQDPFRGTRRFHKGIDITAPTGTPVRATANGFVTQVDRSPSYGLVVVVTHSNELSTRYAHLSRFDVEEGQRVLRGQVIGYVGNTGRSKAPHLHYEVQYKGAPVNPRNYILQ
jgi:murein DD-endopeptidase MepM/ murein hydrolase activator NlpD